MIDTLLDWVDPDNLARLNGAEEEDNYHPPNRMLLRLDEMKRIRGWSEFTSVDDWDVDFTLDGPAAGIDILWASREVLLALPGINEQLVDQFINLRSGPDGIQGNEDDPYQTPTDPQALAVLGLAQAPQIGALLANTPETVWRIISEGRSGEVKRTVRMVINKQGIPVQLLSWKEY
jgi:general secretion pathway protein K